MSLAHEDPGHFADAAQILLEIFSGAPECAANTPDVRNGGSFQVKLPSSLDHLRAVGL